MGSTLNKARKAADIDLKWDPVWLRFSAKAFAGQPGKDDYGR